MRAGGTRRQTRGAEEGQAEEEADTRRSQEEVTDKAERREKRGQRREETAGKRGRLGQCIRQGQCLHAASGKGAGEVWAREAHELHRFRQAHQLSRRNKGSASAKPPPYLIHLQAALPHARRTS